MKKIEINVFFPLIKERREKIRLNQEELGEILGVSQSYISRWENGKAYPRFPELKVMADLFDCTIEELYKEMKEGTLK